MGEVETDHRARRMAEARDLLQVERLPGAVLHAGPEDQCQTRAVFGDGAFDRRHRECAVGLVGLDFDQIGFRRQSAGFELRSHRVAVGRKRAGLHQDRAAFGGRSVETHHHQMQVRGERIHRDHFQRLRADHVGQRIADEGVIGHPRRGFEEVALDAVARPLVHHFVDAGARALRLQAEGIAAEVRHFGAVVARDVEFIAIAAQRVVGVLLLRVFIADRCRVH